MEHKFYRDQALENIARNVIKAYDANLLHSPSEIPIEDIAEKTYGLTVVYQHIRKTGKILGETAFDDTYVAVYDKEDSRYPTQPHGSIRAGGTTSRYAPPVKSAGKRPKICAKA